MASEQRSATGQEAAEKQETSGMSKFQAVELTLTQDQYTIIQHFLPKKYVLVERKSGKRDKSLNNKLFNNDVSVWWVQMSRFSGGNDGDELEPRSKRARTKKIDKYLEEELPRISKKSFEKLSQDAQINACGKILTMLKKHPHVEPFLEPVDASKSGASHYFEIIKEPMDLLTIERNLKSGFYESASQFHADIAKMWANSYRYN